MYVPFNTHGRERHDRTDHGYILNVMYKFTQEFAESPSVGHEPSALEER